MWAGCFGSECVQNCNKGACTYDVCTGRGEGGTPKADAVRKLSKGGCVKMQTMGVGVKKSENFADIYMAPETASGRGRQTNGYINDTNIFA